MKGHGQSGLRIHAPDTATYISATKPTTSIHQTKGFNVSTFNVRTLNDTNNKGNNKLQQIAIGCDKYLIDIVALQEHRLKITDGNEINYQKLNGWTLAHTSSSLKSHGVAILYNERVSKALINIERISERVIAAHLQKNPRVCVISAYAPTNCSKDDESKKTFFEDLYRFISSIPAHTIIILAGDFNARIGMDSKESNPQIVGPNCYSQNAI